MNSTRCFSYYCIEFRGTLFVFLFGLVAALAKTVIAWLVQGDFEWLSLTCLAGLLVAALFGTFLGQNAHTRGTSELVVAGLTGIDPLVAVVLGTTVLGEADAAPAAAFIAFLLAGATAVAGVLLLATVKTAPASATAG